MIVAAGLSPLPIPGQDARVVAMRGAAMPHILPALPGSGGDRWLYLLALALLVGALGSLVADFARGPTRAAARARLWLGGILALCFLLALVGQPRPMRSMEGLCFVSGTLAGLLITGGWYGMRHRRW